MTAWSLDLMDITKDWVSSFVMLCQAFTAADFRCCLFVGLSAFSFIFNKRNECSIGLRSGDWLGHCRIFHFLTSKTPGLLLLCYVHVYYELPPNQLCSIWLNLGRECVTLDHKTSRKSLGYICRNYVSRPNIVLTNHTSMGSLFIQLSVDVYI